MQALSQMSITLRPMGAPLRSWSALLRLMTVMSWAFFLAVLGIGHAQTTQMMGVDVGNIRAPVRVRGLGIELEDVREKPGGELMIHVLRRSHEI